MNKPPPVSLRDYPSISEQRRWTRAQTLPNEFQWLSWTNVPKPSTASAAPVAYLATRRRFGAHSDATGEL